MALLGADRALIATWTTHGMPDNTSTREHAVKLLNQLLTDVDELHAIIDDLVLGTGHDPREPAR